MAVRVAPAIGTPEGRLAGMQALALMERLLLLDELWTQLMDAAARGEDRSALERPDVMRDLVRNMEAALRDIPDQAYELRMMLDSLTDEEFDRGLDAIAKAPGAPSELQSTLAAALPDYEPRGAVITACDFIRATRDEESALLYRKLDALERGETPGGRLSVPVQMRWLYGRHWRGCSGNNHDRRCCGSRRFAGCRRRGKWGIRVEFVRMPPGAPAD